MQSAAAREDRPASSAVVLGALIVLAVILRFYRLGAWGFEGDEIFTLRDSIRVQLDNPRPLLYLLNHYFVLPLIPLDELGLRLVPAIFGVLAIPGFYGIGRRLVGSRAALLGSALLTVSALHVYHSQYARYWSLVFLLSAIYPFALFLGIRDGHRRMLALGLVTGVLAVLAHPVSVLLFGGLGLWVAVTYLRREHLTQLWRQRTIRWITLLVVGLAGAILVRYLPILLGWIRMHDTGVVGDHLLHLPGRPGVKQIAFLMSYAEGLTLPLVLTGLLGICLLWQGRDRSLALLLASVVLVPVTVMVLLSLRTAVSTTYLFSTTPVCFLAAGVFLDRAAAIDWQVRPRWLPLAVLTAIVIIPGMPTLVSQYRDGRRHDFRSTGVWLERHLSPGDLVFSDQSRVLTHYLPDTPVQPLVADPVELAATVHRLHQSTGTGALWIVAPASAQGGFRTNPRIGSLTQWIYDNCQLRNTVGVARLDFRQNQLQIFRCPAAIGLETGVSPE